MRAALPAEVPLEDAVANLSRVAIGVAGMAIGRFDLLRVLTVDRLHEPYRADASTRSSRALVEAARRRRRDRRLPVRCRLDRPRLLGLRPDDHPDRGGVRRGCRRHGPHRAGSRSCRRGTSGPTSSSAPDLNPPHGSGADGAPCPGGSAGSGRSGVRLTARPDSAQWTVSSSPSDRGSAGSSSARCRSSARRCAGSSPPLDHALPGGLLVGVVFVVARRRRLAARQALAARHPARLARRRPRLTHRRARPPRPLAGRPSRPGPAASTIGRCTLLAAHQVVVRSCSNRASSSSWARLLLVGRPRVDRRGGGSVGRIVPVADRRAAAAGTPRQAPIGLGVWPRMNVSVSSHAWRARIGELGGLPVEEAVGRAVVGHEAVLHAGRRPAPARSRRSSPARSPGPRRPNSPRIGLRHLGRRGRPAPGCPPRPGPTGIAVEADRAGEVEPERRRQEGEAAAEAEAGREQRLDPALVVASGGGRPRRGCRPADAGPRDLLDVGHVLERRRRAADARPSARSSRSRARRRRSRRTGARAPRRTDAGRGRRGGSRSRRRSAPSRGRGTPGIGCRPRLERRARPSRARRRRSGRSAAGSRDRSTCGEHLRDEGVLRPRDDRLAATGAPSGGRGAGGRMPRCLPRRSSSRSSGAPASPTRTGSGASRGGSPASAPPAPTSSSSSRRWATRPTSCSASPPRSPTTPDERELDMLLATGEHQSATLVSMALHALGVRGDQPERRRRPGSRRTAATAARGSPRSSPTRVRARARRAARS